MHQGHYVLVRPLGPIDERITGRLVALHAHSERPVFIKKALPEQISRLVAAGKWTTTVYYEIETEAVNIGSTLWDPLAPADDDTYPEFILDIELLLAACHNNSDWRAMYQQRRSRPLSPQLFGSYCQGFRTLRRHLRKFLRTGNTIELISYSPQHMGAVITLLTSYFGEAGAVDAYTNMVTAPSHLFTDHSRGRLIAYLNQDTQPCGFFCFEHLSAGAVGLHAGVSNLCVPGLMPALEAV